MWRVVLSLMDRVEEESIVMSRENPVLLKRVSHSAADMVYLGRVNRVAANASLLGEFDWGVYT